MAETMADCQDSYAVHAANRAVAVADGVSQSLFPKAWADLLTRSFVGDRTFRLDSPAKVEAVRREWWQYFAGRVEHMRRENAPALWYLEGCLADGRSAGSTLAGVRVKNAGAVAYEVLGDTCLILVRGGCIERQISSMPDGAGFGNCPDYVDSHAEAGMRGTPRTGTLDMRPGDRLFLATDALAARFDAERAGADRGKQFIATVNALETDRDFALFVDGLRKEGAADDDTTLVCIEWERATRFRVAGEKPAAGHDRKKNRKKKKHYGTNRKR